MMRFVYLFFVLLAASCSLIFEKSIEGKMVTILTPKDSLVSDVYVQKFYWEKVDHATQYRFQIAEPSFGSITSIVLDTVIRSTELSYSLNPGDYQWRIRAENSGSETDYITRNIFINPADFTSTTVTQESPSNNVTSYVSLSRFSWKSLYDAVEYELEIDTITGNFTSPIFSTSTTALFYNHSLSKRGKYMWRVRAKNANGDYSTYSDMRTYTFDLEAPTLVGPLDKASVRLPLSLSWSNVTDAVTYELFLTDTLLVNPDPSVYPKTGIAQNSYQINTLTVNKDYFWQVKAVDANGYKSALSARKTIFIDTMKKTNWINYTLIVALLFIWAGVGYSIYAAYSGDEYQIKNPKKIVKVNSNPVDTNANYVLSLNYPDPFTKKVYSSPSVGKSLYPSSDGSNRTSANHQMSKPSASSTPSTNKMTESLGKIAYSGRIKSGKKTIGIIRFSDEEKMVQVGEFIDIFTIDNITEDSIGLKYDKKIIYVKKAK